MKLVIDRKNLLDAVKTVIGAVDHKSVLPALSHILFRGDGETITATANNMEIQVQHGFSSDPHEPFEALWPAKRLHDILRSLSDSSVVGIAQKDKDFHITAGRSRFKLACGDTQDFPLSDKNRTVSLSVEVPQDEFGYQLRLVEHAMAVKDVRHHLNGICLQFGAHLTAVATNGHRLAAIEGQTVIGIDDPKELIVPSKSVLELKRHIGASGTVKLEALDGKNGMRADFGDTVVDVRLIDGRYPDMRRVIPVSFCTEIDVDLSKLIGALNRTTILVPETDGVSLDISESGLVISGARDGEEVREEIEIHRFSGDPLTKGFSPRYLIDALEALDGDSVTLLFTNDLVSIKQEGLNATFVVMGRRL